MEKLRNVNLIITNRCNSRCTNCSIWKTPYKEELNTKQIVEMFALKEFENVVEWGISGGEPYMRTDICEVIEGVCSVNKSIESIFITTNASFPERTLESCRAMRSIGVKNPNVGVSIDGTKETNKKIRGVDSYDSAVEMLRKIKELYPEINTSISFTVCKDNCKIEELEHIDQLSKKLGCSYTFRVASESEEYYNNNGQGYSINEDDKKMIMKFIINHKLDDKFMQEQLYYLATNKIPVMSDVRTGRHLCLAGRRFIFVQSNGDIYPCLYSDRIIGNYKNGIMVEKKDFVTKMCPCMTECTIWPMLLDVK